MRCPKCGSRSLRVSVALTGSVCCKFAEDGTFDLLEPMVDLGSRWEKEAPSECLSCGWSGHVSEHAQQPGKPAEDEAEQMTADELLAIKEKIDGALFDPELRDDLERLIGEVELLRSQVEMVKRANQAEMKRGNNPDTMKL